MAVDTDYLDELMKSIEPTIYPDGVPGEEDNTDTLNEDEGSVVDDYESELASIPDKDAVVADDTSVEPITDDVAETTQIDADATSIDDLLSDASETPVLQTEEIELDMNMSEDEIEAMLNAAKSSAEDVQTVSDADDVTDILAMLDGDADLDDIKNTLEKSDNNIALNQSAFDMPDIAIPDIDEDEPEEEAPKKKKAAKKKKKSKSADEGEESQGSSDKKEKKKGGFFSKLLNALTEEEPEEIVIPEQSETGVTDENVQILSELDSEDKDKKKKKKKKKSKDKKGQPDTQGDERDIREKSEGEGGEDDKKKKKPKKEKKPKKQKEEIEEKPSKKLPKKRVRNTFILCLSILAAILVLTFFATEFMTKNEARYAFDNADYETAYADLYGMKLNESDTEIYEKSRTIMFLERKLASYENYMQLGMKAEALNALLEGYALYPSVLQKAQELDVVDQVNTSYNMLTNALSTFGLSTADAEEINGYESAVQYNKRILSIVNGTAFDYVGVEGTVEETVSAEEDKTQTVEDILPEEEDFLPDNPEDIFVE